jgi:hypothetical protein
VPYYSYKGANYSICASYYKAKKSSYTKVSLCYTLYFCYYSNANLPKFLLLFIALLTSSSIFSSLLYAIIVVIATN